MPQLEMVHAADVEAIHHASLRILSETGVILRHAGARERLAKAGALLDSDRVRLPSHLVLDCVASAGKQSIQRGRGEQVRELGDGHLCWHNLGGARDVFDPRNCQRQPATIRHLQEATRLLDALDNVTSITPFFTPTDVPASLMSLAMFRYAMPCTTKPLQGPGVQNGVEVEFICEMAAVIGKPEEVLTLSVSPVSPLTFLDEAVEAMLAIARRGIPFAPLPCPTAGTTAPFSLAGALAQQNAEVLACVVLSQLVQPGLPIIYCGRLAMMEPRTAISVWGGIELGIVSAGTVQVGHYYGFPVNVYGFSTNSHTLDIQSGYERAFNALIPALAGADELSGIGEMEAGVMGSYAQMVCDNEIASGIQRARRGIQVDEDALAVDVIHNVLDGSHNFLSQGHTRHYLRQGEVILTRLAERGSWESWENAGKLDMGARCQAEAEQILANHQVPPLSPEQDRQLDQLLASAEMELNSL